MKRSWLDRLNEQKKHTEQRKALFERMTARKPKPEPDSTAQPQQAPTESAPTTATATEPPAPAKPKAHFGLSPIHVHIDGERDAAKVDRPLKRLINLYLDTAEDKGRRVALLWPGGLTVLPLIHALATRERWEIGDKRGVRGLIYPVKANSFVRLHDISLDRDDLLEWVRERQELRAPLKRTPLRSCREKDLLLFALQDVQPVDGEALNPCMNELIPHFELQDDGTWGDYANRYFENLRGRLRRRKHKGYLKNLGQGLGQPRTSPDALFTLHYTATKTELKRALEALKGFKNDEALPEIILIDVTRSMCRALPNWRKALRMFIGLVHEVLGMHRPGILVVTDDPNVSLWVIKELGESSEDGLGVKWQLAPVLAAGYTNGLHHKGEMHGLVETPKPLGLNLKLTDERSSRLVESFYRSLQKLNLPLEQARPIHNVMHFLQGLAMFPAGIRHLNAYLNESQAEGRVRDKRSWTTAAAEADAFIKTGKAAPRRDELERALKQASQLVNDCYEHTPFALQLAEEVGLAVAGGHKTTVILPKGLDGYLGERFLMEYPDYPDKRPYTEFSDNVRLLRTNQVEVGLSEGSADKIIFARVDENILRLLMTESRIPRNSVVLLSHRSAAYLLPLFRFLLNVQEFSALHTRVSEMLQELEKARTLLGITMLIDDLAPPRLSFTPPVIGDNIDGIAESDAWRIRLDNEMTLLRGEGSYLCVYEPAESDTGFRRVKIADIELGSLVVPIFDDHLQSALEESFNKAGKSLSSKDAIYGPLLRDYHANLLESVNRKFPSQQKKGQADQLYAEMRHIDPELKNVTPELVKTWINVKPETEKTFDEAKAHAPQKPTHFSAMMRALEFDDPRIWHWWNNVIVPIRGSRRSEGRLTSDVYALVLTNPADARTYWHLSKETVQELTDLAKERLATVLTKEAPQRTGGAAND